ncbi:MAG TPA: hypothetical protein VF749_04685, partial [Candidatus Acidoferrum sp.]
RGSVLAPGASLYALQQRYSGQNPNLQELYKSAHQLSNRTKKAAWESPAIEVSQVACERRGPKCLRKNCFFSENGHI